MRYVVRKKETVYIVFYFLKLIRFTDNQLTLEADYIKRYLGDLTPLQESKLVQLKKSFVHSHKGKVCIPMYGRFND